MTEPAAGTFTQLKSGGCPGRAAGSGTCSCKGKEFFNCRLPIRGYQRRVTDQSEIMVRRSRLQRQQVSGKDFLRWIHSKPVYDQWFASQQGFTLGPTAEWQNHPLWQDDPIMLPFRSLAEIGRVAGYAGPPNRAAAEVVTKYIITDMYAKAVQGMPAEDAVKWAHGELAKIYT